MNSSGWCTIESDPGVFTDLMGRIHVTGAQVEELYSLDDLVTLPRAFGVIFLFKWRPDQHEVREAENAENYPELFFANQVINNACATQALLSVLLNVDAPAAEQSGLDIGPTLRELKQFTLGLPSEMKGLAISNSDVIREAHNCYQQPSSFEFEQTDRGNADDDVFHFIAFVCNGGQVFELDGLLPGPIKLGPVPVAEPWTSTVRRALHDRIQRFATDEIRFSLLAVVPDRLLELSRALAAAVPGSESGGQNLELLQEEIAREQAKRAEWARENQRRRWNYTPFLINLLRILAEKNELVPLLSKAREELSKKRRLHDGAVTEKR